MLCDTNAAKPSFGPAVPQAKYTLHVDGIHYSHKICKRTGCTVDMDAALVSGLASKDFVRCVPRRICTVLPYFSITGYHVRDLTKFDDLIQLARPAAAAIPFKPPSPPLPQTQPRFRCRRFPERFRIPALSPHPLPGQHPQRLHSRAPPPPPHPPRVSSPQIEH